MLETLPTGVSNGCRLSEEIAELGNRYDEPPGNEGAHGPIPTTIR